MPLPADFGLRLDAGVRRPRPAVLIGGAPLRVLKLTPAGAARLDGWAAGRPVGPGVGAGRLAARLVEGGLALPIPPGAPPVSVGIVVPVRDDPTGLEATLGALAATAAGVPVHVRDDGSEVPVEGAGGRDVTISRGADPAGPAAARNAGAAALHPEPDVIVFIDAGCVPEPGWLEGLLAHFADPGLGAAAPRVTSRTLPGTPPGLAAYEAARSPIDMGPAPGPVAPGAAVPYVPTAVLAVRAEAFRQVGRFDPGIRFGEDVDLVWRLAGAGWRVRYEPAARATHPARARRGQWLRQRFDYGSSAAPLAARHGRAVSPLWVSPWSAAAWGFVALGRLLPAAAIAAGSAEALSRRAGGDPAVARQLRGLAVTGTLRAAGPLASAVRRAWLPPVAVAAGLGWGRLDRRARAAVTASAAATAVLPGLLDWGRRRPAAPPLRWSAWCLADDLAYQAGVWAGVVRARSAAALLPRW